MCLRAINGTSHKGHQSKILLILYLTPSCSLPGSCWLINKVFPPRLWPCAISIRYLYLLYQSTLRSDPLPDLLYFILSLQQQSNIFKRTQRRKELFLSRLKQQRPQSDRETRQPQSTLPLVELDCRSRHQLDLPLLATTQRLCLCLCLSRTAYESTRRFTAVVVVIRPSGTSFIHIETLRRAPVICLSVSPSLRPSVGNLHLQKLATVASRRITYLTETQSGRYYLFWSLGTRCCTALLRLSP